MRGILALIILSGVVCYFAYTHENLQPIGSPVLSASSTPAQILFVGDVMLDRSIRTVMALNGFDYSFANIKSIFGNIDLAVGNLEGTITENPSISQKNVDILKFTFATTTALELQKLGFTGFSLANNHALDFGQTGFLETEKNLKAVGLSYFGSPLNNQDISTSTTVNGENLCLIGYHELFASSTISVIKEIANLRPSCDYLMVFAHWGNEYSETPSSSQRQIGHAFIDAGADLVVGAHPHVIEPVEIYKNHPIFYSLGNFIFDQDFSLPTRQGLAIRLELGSTTQKFHLIGLEMDKGRLYFPEKEAFQPSLDILTRELPPVYKALADVDGLLILKREGRELSQPSY